MPSGESPQAQQRQRRPRDTELRGYCPRCRCQGRVWPARARRGRVRSADRVLQVTALAAQGPARSLTSRAVMAAPRTPTGRPSRSRAMSACKSSAAARISARCGRVLIVTGVPLRASPRASTSVLAWRAARRGGCASTRFGCERQGSGASRPCDWDSSARQRTPIPAPPQASGRRGHEGPAGERRAQEQAAVDQELGAGREARVARREEEHELRDLCGAGDQPGA